MVGNTFNAKDERRFMFKLLQDEWQEDVEGREMSVPEPVIVEGAGDGSRRAQNTADSDIIRVLDGGDPILEPGSVGFRDRYLEQVIDVEIRTSHSQDRMFGLDEEDYGGLAGEVQRIVDTVRYGAGPYDYIWYDTVTEASEDYGADIWNVEWPVRFKVYSDAIGAAGINNPP